MKKNLTEIVFILDRSGSMGGLESDTINGYNSMIEKQKKEQGDAIVTTVLFDNEYSILNDRIDIKAIKFMDSNDYYVRGTTALLDAIGKSVEKIINVQKRTESKYKADKVIFIITTDGLENASSKYTYNNIKSMISEQQEKYGWEFIFLGANIDAISEAGKLGISKEHSVNYHADAMGTQLNYEAMNLAISSFRQEGSIVKNWKEKVDSDYKSREKNI